MTIRVELLRHDGRSTVPFELSIVDLIEDPTVEGFVISAHDATEQVAAEHQLSETLSLLTATLDSTADGILVVDNDGTITGFNRRFSEIWRIAQNFVAVGDDSSKLTFVLDQLLNPQSFLARHRELAHKPENESFDTLEFKDGRALELTSRPQTVDGTIVGRVWSFRDVTDRIRLEDELEYRAFHDSLTGLANKALFQDRLEHALARIGLTGSHLAVLFIDLDDFKTVNDSLGHGEGDQLLKRVAADLSTCLRPLDTAARLGGDEFAILIEDVSSQEDITLWPGASSNRSVWLSPRGPVLRLGRQHRHRLRRAGHHEREAAPQRGHRHVQGEGERQGPLRGLPEGDARRGAGADRTGARAAGGHPRRRPPDALPADLRPRHAPDHRLRGAGAVGPPDRRPGRPAALRPAGRGARTHRRDRRLRPALVLPAGAPVAGARPLGPTAWS